MNLEKRIESVSLLGKALREEVKNGAIEPVIQAAFAANPWFLPEHIRFALQVWGDSLTPEAVRQLAATAPLSATAEPRATVAIVMAGNIPLVGMHDWLCVLLAGHKAQVKLSSKDAVLLPYIHRLLSRVDAELAAATTFTEGPLHQFDAVIATGSNSSQQYFEYYFGRYPHLIRHSRHSVAVLPQDITEQEIDALGDDLFLYFGLGCRSVSLLYLPEGMSPSALLPAATRYAWYTSNHLYQSCLDYRKALLIMNAVPFVDGGMFMLQQGESLAAPVSIIYYTYYKDTASVVAALQARQEELQCVVSRPSWLPMPVEAFGTAQRPRLTDFADGVNTLQFLSQL